MHYFIVKYKHKICETGNTNKISSRYKFESKYECINKINTLDLTSTNLEIRNNYAVDNVKKNSYELIKSVHGLSL